MNTRLTLSWACNQVTSSWLSSGMIWWGVGVSSPRVSSQFLTLSLNNNCVAAWLEEALLHFFCRLLSRTSAPTRPKNTLNNTTRESITPPTTRAVQYWKGQKNNKLPLLFSNSGLGDHTHLRNLKVWPLNFKHSAHSAKNFPSSTTHKQQTLNNKSQMSSNGTPPSHPASLGLFTKSPSHDPTLNRPKCVRSFQKTEFECIELASYYKLATRTLYLVIVTSQCAFGLCFFQTRGACPLELQYDEFWPTTSPYWTTTSSYKKDGIRLMCSQIPYSHYSH